MMTETEADKTHSNPEMPATGHRMTVLVCLAAVLIVTLALACFTEDNPDVCFYYAKGKVTLRNMAVPRPSEMMSAPVFGETHFWTEKWAFQVMVFLSGKWLGPAGFLIVRTLMVVAIFILLFFATSLKGRWMPVAAFFSCTLACFAAHERFVMRPELPIMFGIAVLIFLLNPPERLNRRNIWVVPLTIVFCVNMHWLFFLCVAVVAAFAVGDSLPLLKRNQPDDVRQRLRKRARLLWSALGLAVVACLANPRFVTGAVTVPFFMLTRVLKSPWYSADAITELRPPWRYELFPSATVLCFKLLLAACAISFIVNIRRLRWAHLILCLGIGIMAFRMRRNISIFALAAPCMIVSNSTAALDWAASKWRRARNIAAGRTPTVVGLCAVVLSVVSAVGFVATNRLYTGERIPRRFGWGMSETYYPSRAADFVERRGLCRYNCFCDRDGGSYLQMRFPDYRPFVNGECDYSLEVFDLYRKIMAGGLPFEPEAEKYGFKFVFLRHAAQDTHSLAGRLYRDPKWQLAFLDEIGAVYLRKCPENEPNMAACAVDCAAVKADVNARFPLDASASYSRRFNRAQAFYRLGLFYSDANELDKAWEFLTLAREAFPEMPEVHNSLGAVALQQGNNEVGCGELREAISLKPDYITPYHNLGRFHRFQAEEARSVEQLSLSIDMLEKARALDPRKTEVLMDLAIARVLKGENSEARLLFEEVLSLNPMHFRAHQNLAALYRGPLHDAVKAQYHAEQAERIQKENLIHDEE